MISLIDKNKANNDTTRLWNQGTVLECHHVSQSAEAGKHLSIVADPGQDGFNLPGIHERFDLPRYSVLIPEDFTLRAHCSHDGTTRFDAAGLYLGVSTRDTTNTSFDKSDGVSDNEEQPCFLKFGVEYYGDTSHRLVSVLNTPFSDEACGREVAGPEATLIISRFGRVLSCYSEHDESSRLRFERAFALPLGLISTRVGFFVQAPFSGQPVRGIFSEVSLTRKPVDHKRE